MRGSLRRLIGLICALAASCAWAQGGQIHFHGAVVTPTCTGLSSLQPTGIQRLSCGNVGEEATGTVVSYSQTVASLLQSHPSGDRLLDYYTGYLTPSALAQAQLVVRTYE